MFKRNLVLAVVVFISTLLGGCKKAEPPFECTDAIGCVTIAPGEPVKLAALQPLSGRLTSFGAVQIRGIELALAHREDQLLGHPIKLQVEDSQCSPEGGANAAWKVVTDPQTVAIIGTSCSASAATASEIMSEAGFIMVSGSNSAASLTFVDGKPGADWHPGYFRTMYNAIQRGQVAAIFAIQELGVTQAATIHDGDKRSQELAETFQQTFTELGGEIVLAAAVNVGDTNMHPVLTAVADSGAEFLFFPIFPPETDYITLQAREVAGLEETILMVCGSTVRSDAFIESVGQAGVGMHFIGAAQPSNEASRKLLSEYEARYGEPPQALHLEFAYDAANITLNALEAVAVQNAQADGTLHIGRGALREAMYATSGFAGVTGTLTCDEFGDCGGAEFDILRLDDPAAGVEGLKSNVVYTFTLAQ